ncbi:PREDICTED: DDB1- and CUL4-associated factor 17-like isoform X1 [Amphimedon queenslandica]|uniref:Uncharacterized protein n=1 Tax=Amphimedon queenslandica TaxID=400682 RepID=A0AAN0JGU5_AMPQE|nr:PREDICTED: DDB1- and CUL4-associated factor 17-like isoform X1 [Amphimedon queenslandica]|eukprot:XP_019855873.1 PREDICTED: DDB1- and CUL4-associated factor 17-like isoform X1 [Amphimedon queenslandica]
MAAYKEGEHHVSNLLFRRTIELDDNLRDVITSKIVHNVILEPTVSFENVWHKTSRYPICIGLDRRIYFNNHTEGYFNDGPGGEPRRLFHFPPIRQEERHCGALLYFCHIRDKPLFEEEKEVCLMILTYDGFLKILNADTRKVLRSVYLSTAVPFRYLSWAEYLESVLVKSAFNRARDNVLSLLLFKIHPLKLIVHFNISKQIFGNQLYDISISDDLLLVFTHRSCKYYSLQWILDNCQTTPAVQLDAPYHSRDPLTPSFIPGVYPNGIPINCIVTSLPPLLFETSCNPTVGVSFGGSPFIYLHNRKSNCNSDFLIKDFRSGRVLKNLMTNTAQFHPDVVAFHFEDYQRILQISGCTLSCYRYSPITGSIDICYVNEFKELMDEQDNQPLISSRGRVIKRLYKKEQLDYLVSAVQDLDYENETNLLYAVITVPEGEQTIAFLCFLDDKTGAVTKKVPLPTWSPIGGNCVYHELDCIIHIVSFSSNHTCYFYRLRRNV